VKEDELVERPETVQVPSLESGAPRGWRAGGDGRLEGQILALPEEPAGAIETRVGVGGCPLTGEEMVVTVRSNHPPNGPERVDRGAEVGRDRDRRVHDEIALAPA